MFLLIVEENIISFEKIANQLGLPITPSKQFKVYIGNGYFWVCDNSCIEVQLCLQGYKFFMDLFILPIQSADVVLDIQWLELLGLVITNYKLLTIKFQWKGTLVQLVGESQINDDFLLRKQLINCFLISS